MNKRELEKLLKKQGFIKRHGGRHDIWTQCGYPPIPIPRHAGDIPRGTLMSILKIIKMQVVQ